jgi:hypothetical protein
MAAIFREDKQQHSQFGENSRTNCTTPYSSKVLPPKLVDIYLSRDVCTYDDDDEEHVVVCMR